MRWLLPAILVPFAIVYLVNALAPETQADANIYHLIPAIEVARTGALPDEITFYSHLPHATELLFVIAYAVGGVPAAKLTHFALLLLSLPLIIAIGRRLGIADPAPQIAAALYFVTPVVGVSGTSAFNDAALVCSILATVWALLAWRDKPAAKLALLAGLFAGMCYAVKMTGGIAVAAGVIFILATRRPKALLPFALGAVICILPWMIRNWIEIGNPFAPFFNALFPNEYFYVAPERRLSAQLRTYGISFLQRFTEVTIGSRLHGIIGPIFLLTPLALLALRRSRTLLVFALIFAAPWCLNAGARFLMPALPFLALALASAFSARISIGILLAHAVLSWPWIIPLYAPGAWRIQTFPWQVATGQETTNAYLQRVSWDYRLAKFVESRTTPQDRIFDLMGLHLAHIADRRILGTWQTVEGQKLMSTLELAYSAGNDGFDEWRAAFTPQPVTGVRLCQQSSRANNWSLNELEFRNSGERIANSSRWLLGATANPWDLPMAFDHNMMSRWSTWNTSRSGDCITIDFGSSEQLDEVRAISPRFEGDAWPGVEVKRPDGSWKAFAIERRAAAIAHPRTKAMQFLKRAGITHIVAGVGHRGVGVLSRSLAEESDWSVDSVDNYEGVYLLKLR